jgi:hypothetical protein
MIKRRHGSNARKERGNDTKKLQKRELYKKQRIIV